MTTRFYDAAATSAAYVLPRTSRTPQEWHPAGAPPVAVAKYNPRTGKYIGPNGEIYQQSDLAAPAKSWQEPAPQVI